jgi:LPS-assembly lipoprotein
MRASVLICLILVAGCGFHLRTWDLTGKFESVHVSIDSSVTLNREFERALGTAGINIVMDKRLADVVVRLSAEHESRRSVSYTGQARVAQYELTLSLAFLAEDAAGNVLLPIRSIQIERTYRHDQENIVGSAEEEMLIVREMRVELVQRILRSLGTVSLAA